MVDQDTTAVLDHVVSALRETTLNTDPWPHCYLADALPSSTAGDIETSFRRLELASVEGLNREKTYRMRTQRLDLRTADTLPSAAWHHLVGALLHERYRDAMAALTGVSLDTADITLDLWEYQDGDWLAPHVDKPDKLVTQLFYFSQSWHPDAGGHLLVLDAADSEVPRERLRPTTGSSAVLVRSETSWHAVEVSRGSGASRCSVAATFWYTGATSEDRRAG